VYLTFCKHTRGCHGFVHNVTGFWLRYTYEDERCEVNWDLRWEKWNLGNGEYGIGRVKE
jgi:hypothetical protein